MQLVHRPKRATTASQDCVIIAGVVGDLADMRGNEPETNAEAGNEDYDPWESRTLGMRMEDHTEKLGLVHHSLQVVAVGLPLRDCFVSSPTAPSHDRNNLCSSTRLSAVQDFACFHPRHWQQLRKAVALNQLNHTLRGLPSTISSSPKTKESKVEARIF